MVMNLFNAIRIFVGGKAVFQACSFLQAHSVDRENTGTERKEIMLNLKDMIGTIVFSPNGNYIVGASDRQNAEFQQKCQRTRIFLRV